MTPLYRGRVYPIGRNGRSGRIVWGHQVIGPGGKIYAADNACGLRGIYDECARKVAALNALDEAVTLIRIQPPKWLNP